MAEVHLPLELDGGGEVRFRANEAIEPSGDAEIALRLVPSMRLGTGLSVDRASRRLLANVPRIQEVLHCWDPGLNEVAVTAEGYTSQDASADRIGAFFSCGVDSFYTALTHQAEITDLIFVHGFDFPLDDAAARSRASRAARDAARELGKNLIEVETDYRRHLDRYLRWVLLHGSALAAVALLLQDQLDKVFVGSTHSYRQLLPVGSHPLLDPLWSTERLQIVHDGAHSGRPGKIARLAESKVAMRHLRICWRNEVGAYNCGRCVECVQAMVNLRLAGALERCATLPDELDLGRVARLPLDDHDRIFARDSLAMLDGSTRNPKLELALRTSLALQPLRSGVQAARNRAGRVRRRVMG
jgi:hypothetical protein